MAASRTETFRDQNHRLQSKFAYCKLFGVYAGVIFHGSGVQRLFAFIGMEDVYKSSAASPVILEGFW